MRGDFRKEICFFTTLIKNHYSCMIAELPYLLYLQSTKTNQNAVSSTNHDRPGCRHSHLYHVVRDVRMDDKGT